jgi:predicted dienelactone hydrolase
LSIVGPVCFVVALACLCAPAAPASGAGYDPLAVSGTGAIQALDLEVSDPARERTVPILVYLPAKKEPAPVVLFSHGLGGSRNGNAFMGRHWAGRGYVTVFVQHPGSDTSVWEDKPPLQRMSAMKRAASAKNYMLRVKDIPSVLDQLQRWNQGAGHALSGRLDLDRVGMSGHSFGAITTQAVSGQRVWRGRSSFTDPRIKAAIAFSPSTPRGARADRAFGRVSIPWMLMTGTKDLARIGGADLASRLAVFEALPPGGNKYEVVFDRAEHSAFTDRALPGDTEPRNPNHHRAILALSTAFWDAWLDNRDDAKTWLDGDGPRSVLEKDDRWQRK